ncbi:MULTISPECIES: hypothetical protein [Pontibacter]|uniref:Uncharacterized protein n=1 Tax=Pontibacter lucknowensis TaxID=1077936 RepID=A0A1N6UXW7_9BACT|nr:MULTISPECIES: hypothetical protein [Pontibacter]EJF11588.1 hypothetical protein O71_02217 [Pontibacter sp. BAB1700]SIQ70136.1 hypothetical protein SAMN05421545_1123 [Pontibacter lucknowensis]
MEEIENVKLSDAGTQLLKRIVGERICYFFTDNIKVQATGGKVTYWAPEFAIGLTKNKQDQRFINVSADYKLTSRSSTTFYEFEIGESRTPLRCEKLLQSGQHSEIRVLSTPVLMIEVYQDWNQEFDEAIAYDAAIVLYTESQKYMLKVREELIGGLDIILDEATIEAELVDLKLRQSLV